MKNQYVQLMSAMLASLGVLLGNTGNFVHAQESRQEVQIKFKGMVGDKPFNCGESYNLGTPVTAMTPGDFRFYVFDVALIDETGKTVPMMLTQDGKWQYQNVALLDFENKTAACANGTAEMRDMVVGTVPKGNYKGVQFNLGVPFNLNHADAALAASPLNLTSLWWNWRGGYKFLRVDFTSPENQNKQIAHNKHGKNTGFMIHVGSTGCQASSENQNPTNCNNPNRSKASFNNFDFSKNTIVADLKTLVANTNLSTNQPDTPLGCMSAPTDGDCAGIMLNLGLPFNGKTSSGQTFFRVE